MSESDSTINVDNSGLHIFNDNQNNILWPCVEDITEEDVEKDITKTILTDYSNCLATTAITIFLNKDFQSNSTLDLNTRTPRNDIFKVILLLKEKFLKNCDCE